MKNKNGIIFSETVSEIPRNHDSSVIITILLKDLIQQLAIVEACKDFRTGGEFFVVGAERLNTVADYFLDKIVCKKCGSKVVFDGSFLYQLTLMAIVYLIKNRAFTMPSKKDIYKDIYNNCATIVIDGYCSKCHEKERYYCSNHDFDHVSCEKYIDIEAI